MSCAAAAGRKGARSALCRAAFSEPIWSKQDPQTPQSIWWHTEATEVGFRLVHVPTSTRRCAGYRSKMSMESPNK
jgi:hypothetical protein